MKIVFVDPPSPPGFVAFRHSHGGFGECCRSSRLKFPTLDIFHSASLLLDHGLEAEVVDSVLQGHSPQSCVAAVLSKRPALIALRTGSGSCPHDLDLAARLKARSAAPVAFFGPQAAADPDRILAHPAVDAVVLGEPPGIFLEIGRRRGFSGVPGVWHKRCGRVVKSPLAALPEDLDFLPIPRWDLVDYRRYSYVTSQTSWGCPSGCGYCPYPVTQGTRWRARSVPVVVREFQELRRRHGLRFVLLRDPQFTFDRRRTVELCRALSAAGAPLMWGCETRLERLDDELIGLMAGAGCVRVAFGVESAAGPVLARMGRRPLPRAQLRTRVEALKRRGMLTYAMYLIGLPGETRRTTEDLVSLALELGTDAAAFSMATPFPGTELERQARARGWITAKDPRHLTSCVASMRNEEMSAAQIERLYRSAKSRWKDRQPSAA